MKYSPNKKEQDEKAVNDILSILFGAAVMEAMKDQKDKEEQEEQETETGNRFISTAKYMKDMYDAFIEVGFDQQQAFVLLNSIVEGISQNFQIN